LKRQVSVIYITEKIPLAQHFMSSDTRNTIGESYCIKNNLLVVDGTTDEIKIVLSRDSLFCMDELRKVLPKKKRILAMLVEREEILRLLGKIYDLFGADHYR
jgi:hypothetical protein